MSDEERIEFLARRVSELESICGELALYFTRNDTSNLARPYLAGKIRGLAEAKYGAEFAITEPSAFRQVADLIINDRSK